MDASRHPLLLAAALAALVSSPGCALRSCPEPEQSEIEVQVYRKAETERAAQLARQVERLKADLAQAEEALVSAESGLRGDHSRADAISSLAEARIQVERAGERAPWRAAEVAEAMAKLDEADRQIAEGHYGSALFFVYRAQRAAETLEAEADRVRTRPEVRYVGAGRVNMRSGPSTSEPVLRVLDGRTPVFVEGSRSDWLLVRASTGDVGWVHRSLIRR
jgi:uncharacterized protein YgiM (DUF1202 family)